MTTLIDLWLQAAQEAHALRAQLAYLEEAWLRAEADADYWYFQACNTVSTNHTRIADGSPRGEPHARAVAADDGRFAPPLPCG
jgi:hypothetical protein